MSTNPILLNGADGVLDSNGDITGWTVGYIDRLILDAVTRPVEMERGPWEIGELGFTANALLRDIDSDTGREIGTVSGATGSDLTIEVINTQIHRIDAGGSAGTIDVTLGARDVERIEFGIGANELVTGSGSIGMIRA